MRSKSSRLFVTLFAAAFVVLIAFSGCKKDDEVTNPPPVTPGALGVSPTSITVASGGTATAIVRGGRKPYSFAATAETLFVAVTLTSDSVLTFTARSGGTTSLIVRDSDTSRVTVQINVTGAITYDLFPLVAGRVFEYKGYAINTNGTPLADPSNVYWTRWTVGTAGPISGTTVLVDSTRLQHPLAGPIGVRRTLLIKKDASTGDFDFYQTLGPFFRAFAINRTDTLRWISVAQKSRGMGGTWTALDSTYIDGTGASVRLQILGEVEGTFQITDSSGTGKKWTVYRTKTYRNIWVGSAQVVTNALTSRLWLAPNIGPVQIHIAQDTENYGHYRILQQKNF